MKWFRWSLEEKEIRLSPSTPAMRWASEEKEREIRLSPSKLSVAADCLRCFWLQEHRIRKASFPFPSLPGGVDRALKVIANEGRDEGGRLPYLLQQDLPGRKLFSEKPRRLKWYCDEINATFLGDPDEWLLEPDGRLSFLDWKTRSSVPDKPHPAVERQLNAYSFLAEKVGGFPRLSGKAYLTYLCPAVEESKLAFSWATTTHRINTDDMMTKFTHAVEVIRGGPPPASIECTTCIREAKIINMSRHQHADLKLTDDFIREAAEGIR